jgi:hypothetical protein
MSVTPDLFCTCPYRLFPTDVHPDPGSHDDTSIRNLLVHNENIIAHDHAGGLLVSKLRIEFITEFSKELDRFIEIFNR